MNPDPNQAKAIFLEALEKHDPEQWPAFLDQACAGHPELRRRVELLLHAHREAATGPDQIGARGLPPGDAGGSVEHSGSLVGPYKLLQQIGEGGMGVVWMAEQMQPVRRKVALKIIKAGMDTRQVIARFEAERQALALMDHPNIAKVFDAGATDTGRPFFVMELVKGVPITRYCDEHRLTPRQRLELFLPVCQAVQHAHQKGIIHRDLKPSNVLVAPYDGKPVVKVIDFGVAKATGQRLTERTLFTEFGAVVGTLEYMSPEQAELNNQDIDTRSDLYSLGVLLYELLTGTTPLQRERFQRVAFTEILRMIREEEPPRPSTRLSSTDTLPALAACRQTEPAKLTKLVRGELDWIVMKALEKDRSRRYDTANDFALDVQRYLADEPVQACPPSTAYRLRKLVRRNKGPLVAAAVVFLALVGGTVAATLGLIEARKQRAAAEANEKEALLAADAEKKAKETAQTREAETSAVLDFVLDRVFGAARPEGKYGGLGHDVTLRRALKAALPFVDKSFAEQPLIEARVRMSLGLSFSYLGDGEIAVKQYERARALYTRHRGPDDADTLRSMMGQALCYHMLGRDDEALRLHEETLALLQAKLGPDDPDTLAAMNNKAISYAALGRHADALELRKETLALMKDKLGTDHADTLMSMNNLAISYAALGRYAEALELLEVTLALKKAKFGRDHPDTLTTLANLANCNFALGRHAAALELREQTLALRKAKLGTEHADTLMAMNNLALSYAAAGNLDLALPLCEETLKMRQAQLGAAHPDTIVSMKLLTLTQKARDAHRRYDEVRRARGPAHLDTLLALRDVAQFDLAFNRLDEAESALAEVLAGLTGLAGDDPIRVFTVQVIRECLAAREKRDPAAWATFNTKSFLGGALLGVGQFTEAEPLLLAGYEGMKRQSARIPAATRTTSMTEALDRLVRHYEATGNKDEAEKWRQQRNAARTGKD
jgi:eukaryotic-like serine/threonine-protein kinase